jgi:hypothetical protein
MLKQGATQSGCRESQTMAIKHTTWSNLAAPQHDLVNAGSQGLKLTNKTQLSHTLQKQ